VNEQASSLRHDGEIIRVSKPVKARLITIQLDLAQELGRYVTFSEVIEELLADQWGPRRES
jgi:hypothetical protein